MTRNTNNTRLQWTTLLTAVLVGGVFALAFVGGATATDAVTITFDDDDSFDLIAEDVDDATGVGAYEITISYDADEVNLDVIETDRFAVETNEDDDGERTMKTIVGYTGESNETPGTVMLADVTATDISDNGDDTTLEIESVETFADVDGDAIEYETRSVTLEGAEQDDDDDGNGLPPIGGTDDDEEDDIEDDVEEDDEVVDDDEPVEDDDIEDDVVEEDDDEPVEDDEDVEDDDEAVEDDDVEEDDDPADDEADDVVDEIPQPLTVPILALALVVGYRLWRSDGSA